MMETFHEVTGEQKRFNNQLLYRRDKPAEQYNKE